MGSVFPVETNPACLVLHGKRFENRRNAVRNPGKDALVASLFLGLHQFPLLRYRLGIHRLPILVSEDVGMPEDHLLAEPVDDVGDVVTALFFRDFAVEDNVQKDVAELFFQVVVILL